MNRGKVYDKFSIKERMLVTKDQREGSLFMSNYRGNAGLNRLIDKLDKPEKDDELRIKYFRKNPTFGSQIFQCTLCATERIYGHSGTEPEVKNPLILCEGTCKKNTVHLFIRVHFGREVGL